MTNDLATTGSLDLVTQNEELQKLYQDNAHVGADNLGDSLPLLKIFSLGKMKDTLANGNKPTHGWYFHTTTQEQIEKVECHLLASSAGFKTAPNEKSESGKPVHNQLIAGLIVNEGRKLPFLMYLNGLKLDPFWEYGREIAKFTRAKPTPIPMFALKTIMTYKDKDHSKGSSPIPQFSYLKNKEGHPVVVTDPGLFIYLRDMAEEMRVRMQDIIDRTSIDVPKINKAEMDAELDVVFGIEPPHPAR